MVDSIEMCLHGHTLKDYILVWLLRMHDVTLKLIDPTDSGKS